MSRTSQRFPIRFGRVNAVLLTIFGFGPRRSFIEVADDEVRVKMGWGFSATIPRSSITAVERRGNVWWAIGVHALNWGMNRWIVNGSMRGIVKLLIEPPARARTVGFRAGLRELWVSVNDPDALVAALRPVDGR